MEELGCARLRRGRRRAPRSAARPGARGRAGGPRRSGGTPGRARARPSGRRRAGARRRGAGRREGAGAAGRARGRSSRRRPCARAGRPRSRGARRGLRAARASAGGSPRRRGCAATIACRPGMGDLGGEEVEEAVELVRVAAHRRARTPAGSVVRGVLDRADVELEPVAVALDPAEHAHRVALAESRVEQVDVVPDARLDAAARVDELEREVRGAVLRPQPPLARDRVDALDDAVLGQLGDRAHTAESRPEAAARVRLVAVVKPFRAAPLRRGPRRAARLARRPALRRDLVVRSGRSYLTRSPYNVVHLTLPDDEAEAAHALCASGRTRASSSATTSPRSGGSSQDYIGPDGVPRTPRGARRRAAARALRGGRRAPARAHPRRAEGGPPAPAARDPHAGRAALLPLRGLARAGRAASRRSTWSSTASAAVSGACRATRRPSSPTPRC